MNRAAQQLGRLGGKANSEAKSRAARENWRKAVKALVAKRRKAANVGVERRESSPVRSHDLLATPKKGQI